jgi:hypothetical protein
MDDRRLYAIEPGWKVQIKPDDGRTLYCFLKGESDEGYPRIMPGEIYVTNENEVYNINSAIKKGILSAERPRLGVRPGGRP